MKRGEIYFAKLDPTIGDETKKKRPVLIVSNDANNRAGATITILPITSNTKKVYPFEIMLSSKDSGLRKHSKAQCQQIRTISKLRVEGKMAGCVSKTVMREIDAAMKLHLDLQV